MIKSKIANVAAQALIKDTLITFDGATMKGTLKIKINLEPLGGTSKKVIPITGFKTQAQLTQAANTDIETAKTLFDGLKNVKSGSKTKLDSTSTTLPSTLKDKTISKTIGFDNPSEKANLNDKGVTATFNVKSNNNDNGKIVVEVNLSKDPNINRKVEFTLTGYSKTFKLSKGVIAGITIGASVVTLGLAFIVFRFLKLKKSK